MPRIWAPGIERNPLMTSMKLLSLLLILCSVASAADTYQIVHTYPHDPQSFTQGLVFVDGHLYESTGLNGRSTLRMDDLETGRPPANSTPRHPVLRRRPHRLGQHAHPTHMDGAHRLRL